MREPSVIETPRLVSTPLSGRDLDEIHVLWAGSEVRRRGSEILVPDPLKNLAFAKRLAFV